ncbi:MAG: hypothetical protein WD768_22170 [Phycisphaeraceae bacterium]
MLRTANTTGHSAVVELELQVDGKSIPLAQTSADWIMVDAPTTLPPCEGVVVVTVDGREHRSRVRLEKGVSPDVSHTPVSRLD